MVAVTNVNEIFELIEIRYSEWSDVLSSLWSSMLEIQIEMLYGQVDYMRLMAIKLKTLLENNQYNDGIGDGHHSKSPN